MASVAMSVGGSSVARGTRNLLSAFHVRNRFCDGINEQGKRLINRRGSPGEMGSFLIEVRRVVGGMSFIWGENWVPKMGSFGDF
jgi:hypothetical protein